MTDLRRMQVGQVVDYIIAFNERQERGEEKAKKEEKTGRKRKATQADIDAFFG